MIYITQLVFVHPGMENQFLEFEDQVLPLLAEYTGRMQYRVRPTPDQFIDLHEEPPFEIHILSFESISDLRAFLQDSRRQELLPLKTGAIRMSLTIHGEAM